MQQDLEALGHIDKLVLFNIGKTAVTTGGLIAALLTFVVALVAARLIGLAMQRVRARARAAAPASTSSRSCRPMACWCSGLSPGCRPWASTCRPWPCSAARWASAWVWACRAWSRSSSPASC